MEQTHTQGYGDMHQDDTIDNEWSKCFFYVYQWIAEFQQYGDDA